MVFLLRRELMTHYRPSDTHKQIVLESKSALAKYQDLVVGKRHIGTLIKYELVSLLSTWVPGALGLVLRSRLYRWLLGSVGKNVFFGTNVILRHPHKIVLGNNVVINDQCVLDAKGDNNSGIVIGNNVFVDRNSNIFCQNGAIEIADNVNIGANCQIFSAKHVKIGRDVLIGAFSYLVGGGHIAQDVDVPINQQGRKAEGIILEDDVWVGADVKILDGITIGRGAILGAGAVVKDHVPAYTIVGGVPAKTIGNRILKKAPPL